jgi:hypothetical protein
MSRGKYSPNCPNANLGLEHFQYNCYGQVPTPWSNDYDEKTMYGDYDDEGYDSYGYSAFDAEGLYVGSGHGVDRDGYTEEEYLTLQDLSGYDRRHYYD